MLIALTHMISPNINNCELTFLKREPIQIHIAEKQHKEYCNLLRKLGVEVSELTVNRSYPDSTFIEDTAVVVDELAVMTHMGIESRRGEVKGIERELMKYRKIVHIRPPATLEGGDVLQAGKTIFAGLSPRTNKEGIESLKSFLKPLGYQVKSVVLHNCLHLKSAVTAMDDNTLLVNPDWLDLSDFAEFRIISIPKDEPWAANLLRVRNVLIMHSVYVKTIQLVRDLGYTVKNCNISELIKAEAALTCSSILFNHPVRKTGDGENVR